MITPERVRQIHDEDSLFAFLSEELRWPFEDTPDTFEFYADELRLTPQETAQIESVRQIANFEAGQPFGIFLVKFSGEQVYKNALRRVLRGLSETRRDRDAALPAWKAPNLLFLCTANYRDWTIARFSGDSHTRATLSRFGWEQKGDEGLRTLCDHNLPALTYPENPSDADAWRSKWAAAFDVEAVTKRFYAVYESVFKEVEGQIQNVAGDKRLFTQSLFNRLMFVHFLSKKGWLKFNGRTDYLAALWEGRIQSGNFYHTHLYHVFFEGLNNPQAFSLTEKNPFLASHIGEVPYLNGGLFAKGEQDGVGATIPDAAFDSIINKLFLPFNFTVEESTPLDVEVAVDPEMLGKVFEELVTGRHESGSYYTPRPVVAFMCREALKGYLSEALIPPCPIADALPIPIADALPIHFSLPILPKTGLGEGGDSNLNSSLSRQSTEDRGDSNSNPPLSRQSTEDGGDSNLNPPLSQAFLGEGPGVRAIAELVDERKTDSLNRGEIVALMEKLKAVRVVDPACGSGAYLLGMLHELFDLISLLEVRADPPSEQDRYRRKLAIIRHSLYGVDKDEFAVNIARLRLWLALAVEFAGATPEPLPNLDFKVETGDSLTAPDPSASAAQTDARGSLIAQFSKAKADFGNPYFKGNKSDLKVEIGKMRGEIADWTRAGKAAVGLDWVVEFAEVFAAREPVATIGGAINFGQELAEAPEPGGFDIVLANPPYVRQELIKDLKPALKAVYPKVFSGTADLYCFFYARALQLLRPGGMLAFITPNKWLRTGYGSLLRKHLVETCHIQNIIDFNSLKVFQNVALLPMVITAQKSQAKGNLTLTEPLSLEFPYPDILALVKIIGKIVPADAINGSDWNFANVSNASRFNMMQKNSVALGEYIPNRVINGVKTGLNSAFVVSEETAIKMIEDAEDTSAYLVPYVRGDDIRKYSMKSATDKLLYIKWGDNLPDNHPIIRHLAKFDQQLKARDGVKPKGQCPWFALSRPRPESADLYRCKAKIVYPVIAKEARFTLDITGGFINDKCFAIPSNDLYLLGVLNSSDVWDYLKNSCSKLLGGSYELKTPYILQLPIPAASDADKVAIAALVQQCLDAKGVDCAVWEREIDARVAGLYGL